MASKRAIRRRVCGDKHRYATQDEAMRAAWSYQARLGGKVWPYRCSWCGQWHYGHKEIKEKERV